MDLRFAAVASLALALGLALVTPSGAMPFTEHFAAVQAEVNEREAALPANGRTKAQKKQASAHKTVLKKLAKNSTKLSKDFATGSTVTKKLTKAYPGNETIQGIIGILIANLLVDVGDGLDDLDRGIAALAAKPAVKAAKDATKGRDLLGRATAATTVKDKYKFGAKAAKKLESGNKNLAKAGGGGGGANCVGRAPTGGENATGTFEGRAFNADVLSVTVEGDVTRWIAHLESCGAGSKDVMDVQVSGEPTVGFHNFGQQTGTPGSLSIRVSDTELVFVFSAVIEVTSYNEQTGAVEGRVTNADPAIDVTFRTESGF